MNANTLDKLKKLCENNPNKCADIRQELCKKMFILSGYQKIPEDACKMYINIVESIKAYVHPKKIVKLSIKPCNELFYAVSLYGNSETKNFFKNCGYDIPKIVKISTKAFVEETPTIKIKSTIKKKSSVKR